MMRSPALHPFGIVSIVLALPFMEGCALHDSGRWHTPASVGLNTNNLIDPSGQAAAEEQNRSLPNTTHLVRLGHPVTLQHSHAIPVFQPATPPILPQVQAERKTILCLSGGGAYGAYSAGVLCGWSQRGDRPCFDVVTGISTGALMAPFAFLGSQFDDQLREVYTTTRKQDVYRPRLLTVAAAESLANNKPLVRMVDEMLTPEIIQGMAQEHAKGRRLYIGTTELESKRFVIWDLGAIASRGTPGDRDLILNILIASAAVPGVFPSVKIPVTVNGELFFEKHVDGAMTHSLFFRPPCSSSQWPASATTAPKRTDVYVIVAGKLFADAAPVRPSGLRIVVNNFQNGGYAKTRSDIFEVWARCQMQGMNFHLTAIPPEYPAPTTNSSIDPREMTGMFQEGIKQMLAGNPWRNTPPGFEPGEEPLVRTTNQLVYVPRSMELPQPKRVK